MRLVFGRSFWLLGSNEQKNKTEDICCPEGTTLEKKIEKEPCDLCVGCTPKKEWDLANLWDAPPQWENLKTGSEAMGLGRISSWASQKGALKPKVGQDLSRTPRAFKRLTSLDLETKIVHHLKSMPCSNHGQLNLVYH